MQHAKHGLDRKQSEARHPSEADWHRIARGATCRLHFVLNRDRTPFAEHVITAGDTHACEDVGGAAVCDSSVACVAREDDGKHV